MFPVDPYSHLPGRGIRITEESLVYHSLAYGKLVTFSPANSSESRVDRAADPEWHKRRPPRFPLIIDAEWESLRQHPMESEVDWMNTGKENELESQDLKGLSRESNRQLQLRTIQRIVRPIRGLLPHPRVLRRSSFRFVGGI